jgi:hypothetical protein
MKATAFSTRILRMNADHLDGSQGRVWIGVNPRHPRPFSWWPL